MKQIFEGYSWTRGDGPSWFRPETIKNDIFHCPVINKDRTSMSVPDNEIKKIRITIEEI